MSVQEKISFMLKSKNVLSKVYLLEGRYLCFRFKENTQANVMIAQVPELRHSE